VEKGLPPHAYSALIARWAWQDISDALELDDFTPPFSRSLIQSSTGVSLLVNQIEASTLLWISEMPLSSVRSYIDELLVDLWQVAGPALPDAVRTRILGTYKARLQDLSGSDFLLELCRSVLEATLAVYKKYEVLVPPDLLTRVSVELKWDKAPPARTFTSPFNGSAYVTPTCRQVCTCERDGSSHAQQLTLELSPPYFDVPTANSLVFVLFHECVSHVMQGPYRQPRTVPPSWSPFAEGWMDQAAIVVMRRLIQRTLKCRSEIPYPDRHELFLTGAEDLFRSRHNSAGSKIDDADAAGRRRGKAAAERIIGLYGRTRFVLDPYDIFLHLSIALNAADVSITRRDRFVQQVSDTLRCGSPYRDSVRARAERSLRQYATDKDISQLLDQLDSHYAPSRAG